MMLMVADSERVETVEIPYLAVFEVLRLCIVVCVMPTLLLTAVSLL
jgi:hypothetical protein